MSSWPIRLVCTCFYYIETLYNPVYSSTQSTDESTSLFQAVRTAIQAFILGSDDNNLSNSNPIVIQPRRKRANDDRNEERRRRHHRSKKKKRRAAQANRIIVVEWASTLVHSHADSSKRTPPTPPPSLTGYDIVRCAKRRGLLACLPSARVDGVVLRWLSRSSSTTSAAAAAALSARPLSARAESFPEPGRFDRSPSSKITHLR